MSQDLRQMIELYKNVHQTGDTTTRADPSNMSPRSLMLPLRSTDMYTPIRPVTSCPSSLSKPGQFSRLDLRCTS